MQTVWVLMAECGFIQPPFRVVKSYGKSERRDARAVVPVKIGIETFYKVFRNSRPSHTSTAEEKVLWDLSRGAGSDTLNERVVDYNLNHQL